MNLQNILVENLFTYIHHNLVVLHSMFLLHIEYECWVVCIAQLTFFYMSILWYLYSFLGQIAYSMCPCALYAHSGIKAEESHFLHLRDMMACCKTC